MLEHKETRGVGSHHATTLRAKGNVDEEAAEKEIDGDRFELRRPAMARRPGFDGDGTARVGESVRSEGE